MSEAHSSSILYLVMLSHMVEYYFGNVGIKQRYEDRELLAKLHEENDHLFYDYRRQDLQQALNKFYEPLGFVKEVMPSKELRKELGVEVGNAWRLTAKGEQALLEAPYVPEYIKEGIRSAQAKQTNRPSEARN